MSHFVHGQHRNFVSDTHALSHSLHAPDSYSICVVGLCFLLGLLLKRSYLIHFISNQFHIENQLLGLLVLLDIGVCKIICHILSYEH